jgi:hypothetical protein
MSVIGVVAEHHFLGGIPVSRQAASTPRHCPVSEQVHDRRFQSPRVSVSQACLRFLSQTSLPHRHTRRLFQGGDQILTNGRVVFEQCMFSCPLLQVQVGRALSSKDFRWQTKSKEKNELPQLGINVSLMHSAILPVTAGHCLWVSYVSHQPATQAIS